MNSVFHALVISPDAEAIQQIQAAFEETPEVKVSVSTDWRAPVQHTTLPNILILHSDTPSDWLRNMRSQGYTQPALVLTQDIDNPTIAPLDDDLRPIENVTWDVMRAGGLPHCVSYLLKAG
jgi:hypothetical protein